MGFQLPLPAPSTTPSIHLGFEAVSRGRVQQRDALASDEEEEKSCDEDEFIEIDDSGEEVPSVVRGLFSTSIRGLKPKKVKGKPSWVFNHGFRVYRKKELYWKCSQSPCKSPLTILYLMKIYLYFRLGKSTVDEYEFGETIYPLKHGPSSVGKHLKGGAHNL
jgi:hypothetical protein